MPEDDTDRIQGVDFTNTSPVLEDVSYPITVTQLVEQYGDHSVKRTNAEPITIHELFESMGDDTFESPSEIRQMILTLMPEESVGREGYSDRGDVPSTEIEQGDERDENESI